jgi:hypothetical protein
MRAVKPTVAVLPAQQFQHGDLVEISRDRVRSWSPEPTRPVHALVIGSYADLYPSEGRTNTSNYSLFVLLPQKAGRPGFAMSWFGSGELTLVRKRTLKSCERVEKLNRGEPA